MIDIEDEIHLFDPFDPTADLTAGVGFNGSSPEVVTVRKYSLHGALWFGFQLRSPPAYKALPSDVAADSRRILIVRQSDPAYDFSEVSFTTYPSSRQFRPDYYNVVPGTVNIVSNARSTGMVQVNASHEGETLLVYYWQTGPSVLPKNFVELLAGQTVPGDLGTTGSLTVTGDLAVDSRILLGGLDLLQTINNVRAQGRASVYSNWEIQTEAAADWQSLCSDGGVLVAVAQSGSNRVLRSADGYTWTEETAASLSAWSAVAFGAGVFVAVATDGSVMTSPDGAAWTAQTSINPSGWTSLAFGGGLFVAVAVDGSVITSPDGVTWTAQTASSASSWSSITYGSGLFVAVAQVGASLVMTSPDGINWTSQVAASASSWAGVTYGDGRFVAVGGSGLLEEQVMTSPDGVAWTSQSASERSQWNSVAYGNGIFAAVAAGAFGDENKIMISVDGENWSSVIASEKATWVSVTFDRNRFVAISNAGGFVARSLAAV